MTAIGILGVRGRMGQAIGNAAAEAGATIAGGIDRDGLVHGDHATTEALAAASDVLVDFTTPDALAAHLAAAVDAGTPIVIGTTGLTEAHHGAIDAAAPRIPIVQTANTFKSEVKVVKDDQEANGKSIMGLLTLVAAHGVTMTVVCDGDDAEAAVAALAELVGTGFGEGVDP